MVKERVVAADAEQPADPSATTPFSPLVNAPPTLPLTRRRELGLAIIGIVLMIIGHFLIGLIVLLIGLVAFGGFARGKWY